MNEKYFYCLLCLLLLVMPGAAENVSNLLAQGEQAETSGDMTTAAQLYAQAEKLEPDDVSNLCTLSKKYCNLMFLAAPAEAQKNLLDRATACARRAVEIDPTNSTAHASLAVCYAKACSFADIKGEVTYSRMFKTEAETAIGLNPREDVAYYLLGCWHYNVTNIGLLSRAYVNIVYGGFPSASNEKAVANFKKAIALAPGRAFYHAGLAKAYKTMGQTDSAQAEFKKCVALKPLDRNDRDAQQDASKELNSMTR
jgi:tetratricopeptide (TPR) repeat protein